MWKKNTFEQRLKKTTTNKTREPIYKYYEIFSLKSIIHLNISRLDKNRIICSWIDWTWVVYSTLNFFLSANLSNWTANIDMISTRFLIFIKFTAFLKRKKNQKCLFLIFCLSVFVSIELYHWKFWAKEFERILKMYHFNGNLLTPCSYRFINLKFLKCSINKATYLV